MCLDRVDKSTKKGIRYAYKVFMDVSKSGFYPIYYQGRFWNLLTPLGFSFLWRVYPIFRKPYEIGRWYLSSNLEIKAADGTFYNEGYHSYIKESDAHQSIPYMYGCGSVLKVEIKGIVASGVQDRWDVIVARGMRLTERNEQT